MRKLREEFIHEFNPDVQLFLLGCMLADPDIFARVRTIVKDEYFDDQLAPTVRFILHHVDEFHVLPEIALIQAKTGVELALVSDIVRQKDWFLSEIEAFCRYRAMENAILDGIDHLRNGNAGEVERQIKDAMTIRLSSDLGTNYFHAPADRLRRMLDRSRFISTGWPVIDKKLFGGFGRGGLNVFCGGSGSGKSLVLQNLALNWVFAGYVVVYFTLELSEDLVSLRLDSMVSGKSTKEVLGNISEVELILGTKKAYDRLYIKKMPEGETTTNDLRAFLKEFEIQTGCKPDAIIIDYLDLVYPNNSRIDPSDLFVKDKFVSEEIRGLMNETNAFGATASQLNRTAFAKDKDTKRSAASQGEFDHSHIAGGISKINTADNVIAIAAPNFQTGEYTMIFLKTRSSSGVGQHIKLRYDRDSMRITDETPDETVRSYGDIRTDMTKEAPVTRGKLATMVEESRRKY